MEEMKEKGKKGVISLRDLSWKKSSDFREKFADVMRVGFIGERGVLLEFGHVDCDGYEKDGSPKEPYICLHTRIFVSFEHLKEIGRIISNIVREEEEKRGGEKNEREKR